MQKLDQFDNINLKNLDIDIDMTIILDWQYKNFNLYTDNKIMTKKPEKDNKMFYTLMYQILVDI